MDRVATGLEQIEIRVPARAGLHRDSRRADRCRRPDVHLRAHDHRAARIDDRDAKRADRLRHCNDRNPTHDEQRQQFPHILRTYLTHPTYPTYFPENASGLNAGLTLIVLNVHSSVVFPSTDRET